MLLPVAVMALTLTCVAATDYGLASIDVLAYGKYALFWLLPTILLCTSIGALPAALTGLPLGPLAALLWGWTARRRPGLRLRRPASRPATRRWAGRRCFLETPRARWREAASPPSCWGGAPGAQRTGGEWKRRGRESVAPLPGAGRAGNGKGRPEP